MPFLVIASPFPVFAVSSLFADKIVYGKGLSEKEQGRKLEVDFTDLCTFRAVFRLI